MKVGGKPMKDRHLEEKPACSVQSAPFPTEVLCSECGKETEVWSDEQEAICYGCGTILKNRE